MNTRSYAALVALGITVPIACSLVNAPAAVEAGTGGNGGGGGATVNGTASSTGPGGPLCGDGKIEAGETCNPPSSCPTTCPKKDACSSTKLIGEASSCTAACVDTEITTCLAATKDGCCPAKCNGTTDLDCVHCGDGVVELGETCDDAIPDAGMGQGGAGGAASSSSIASSSSSAGGGGGAVVDAGDLGQHVACPMTCDDGDACTTDTMTGSAATCDVACTHVPIACMSGDGCCPMGCTVDNDDECTILQETTYTSSLSITAAPLTDTLMTMAFDGQNYWSGSGGNPSGTNLAEYTEAGALIQTFIFPAPGFDVRSIFSVDGKSSPIYLRADGQAFVSRMIASGIVQTQTNLIGGSINGQGQVVFTPGGTGFMSLNTGTISFWDLNGNLLPSLALQGFGVADPAEKNVPPGAEIVGLKTHYFTFSTQLSEWSSKGVRLKQATLTGTGSGFAAYAFSYANGHFWMVDPTNKTYLGFTIP